MLYIYIYMNIAKFISFYPLQLNQIKYLCAYINFMGSGGGDVVQGFEEASQNEQIA